MRRQDESDLFFIEIMLDRLLRIDEYLQKLTSVGFSLNDEIVLDNLAFQLAQAGEQLASGKLSTELRERFQDVQWTKIRRLRNFISHSYVSKQNYKLIEIIKEEVPEHIEQLQRVRRYLVGVLEDGVEQ